MTTLVDGNLDLGMTAEPFVDLAEFELTEDPGVRRQTALAILGKVAQETNDDKHLFVEAAVLAAQTLEADHFVAAHLPGGTSTAIARIGNRPTARSQVDYSEIIIDRNNRRNLVAQVVDSVEPLVIADLSAAGRSGDPLFNDQNAGSVMLCPVQYAGHQYGAIGVWSRKAQLAAKEDVLFLQSLSLLLGPAVAYQRTEAVLAQHSAMLTATIDSLDSMVLVLSPDGKIVRANQACEERTGFQAKDLIHRHFWGVYLLPEEIEISKEAFGELRRGKSPVRCEMFLLTKSGERRRVAWSFTHLPKLDGEENTYVASGIDITEHHVALENLERIEAKIHSEQVDGGGPTIPKNRRHAPRQDFPYVQLIGPIQNSQLPAAEDFQEVRCRDISPSGFSYVTKNPPDYPELVVALGADPSQLYLTAKIVHVNRFNENDQEMMLVGCKYTARVKL